MDAYESQSLGWEQEKADHTISFPDNLYRGDACGLKNVGFDSFDSRQKGRMQAIIDLLGLPEDDINKKMDEHQQSKFLSSFVSITSDIRVACYFATNGCKNDGCIYVIKWSPLAKSNTFNTKLIALCDNVTIVGESELVWFSYIDPKYIEDEIMVTPDDCKCLPNP